MTERTTRLLTNAGAERQDLRAYQAEGGWSGFRELVQSGDPEAFLAEVEASRLRGRGGARFPTATKLRMAREADGTTKHVVANGGEHEPGSHKDKFLAARYPHEILEGLLIAAWTTGAEHAWVYLIEDMDEQIASIESAIDEARSANLVGEGILGTDLSIDVRVHRAPTTYVAGEETAAIDSIEGGPGRPRKKPPYPGQEGIGGHPTTVQNVETLAHLAWIAREGAEAFASIGTTESTGTMLFTLPDSLRNAGVHELPFGITYRQILDEVGGGTRDGRRVVALLPALSCSFVAADDLDVVVSHEALAELGTSPGCGGIHLILEGEDPVERIRDIARFFMAEQCGQCPPCRMETNQFVHILEAVLAGKKGDYMGQLTKIATFAHRKGNCSLIEMAAAPVLSGARLFASAFDAKAESGNPGEA
ncbi:MAG: hypothetical protein KDC95_21065 [Planctomycetes bacterium]|nr:hypothetical protein [Planctomycetota bacterium]